MSQYVINIGALPNDGTGDPLRTAFNEVNLNFNQVFAAGPVLSNIQIANNSILTTNTNGNLILNPNGIGIVQANAHVVPDQTRIRNLGSANLRWNNVYTQYVNIAGDAIIGGNLSVAGNVVEVGNIVTDSLTIQLANTAVLPSSADGAGITVGANDDIATILYNSTSNVWTTNIGLSTGNIILSGDDIFDLNGPKLSNGDLESGWTARLALPTNGNSNPVTLQNTYGNIILSAGQGAVITSSWVFSNDGNLTTTGNIVAGSFYGDGSHLTGLPAGYANANVVAYAESGWAGNIIPSGNAVYSLGNSTNQWSDLFVSNATIYMNNIPISLTSGNVLTVDGQPLLSNDSDTTITTTGNITAGYFSGDGSQLTNLPFNASEIYNGNSSVNIPVPNDNVIITTNDTNTWNFSTDGNLQLPLNGSVNLDGGNIFQQQNNDLDIRVQDQDNDGWGLYNIVDDGAGSIFTRTGVTRNNFEVVTDWQNNVYTWNFDNTGMLNTPGGINGPYNDQFNIKVVDGGAGVINLQTISYAGETLLTNVTLNHDNVSISTATAGYTWNFDNTGVLTLPANGDFAHIQSQTNKSIDIQTTGNTIAQLQLTPTDGVKVYTNNGNNGWQFDNNGLLTVPGGIDAQEGNDLDIRVYNPNSGGGVTFLVQNYDVALDNRTTQFEVQPANIVLTTDFPNARNQWGFNVDGSLSFPTLGNVSGAAIAYAADDEISFGTTTGNISLWPGDGHWIFDTNGGLTFPDSTVQTTAYQGPEGPFSVQAGNFNAVAGGRYGVDTYSADGPVTATLPATPATGDAVFFADAGNYANNGALTIDAGTNTIMNGDTTMVVSTNNQSVGLFWNGRTWRTYNAG